MDFDREMELENAGFDAFEFSLMDEDERREALEDAFLDPDDYDLIEYDTSFDAWSNLQNAGLSLSELEYMDEDEKREKLEEAGLDPMDYDIYPSYTSSYTPYVSTPPASDKYIPPVMPHMEPVKWKPNPEPEKEPEPEKAHVVPEQSSNRPDESAEDPESDKEEHIQTRKTYRFCCVSFPSDNKLYFYRTGNLNPQCGDYVEVPVGATGDLRKAKVISVGDYAEEVAPVPIQEGKYIARVLTPVESPLNMASSQYNSGDLPGRVPDAEQEKILNVYRKAISAKTQNWVMALVSIVLLLGAVLLFAYLWYNNNQGTYDVLLAFMVIAEITLLALTCRSILEGNRMAKIVSSAERKYPWLEGTDNTTLKEYDRDSNSKDRLTMITIIGILAFSLVFAFICSKVYEERQKEAEALAVHQAEVMYAQGLNQFATGDYKTASQSFEIARQKNIEESVAYYLYSIGMDYAASKKYDTAELNIRNGANAAISTKTKQLGKQLLTQVQKEHKAYDEQQEKQYLQGLSKSLPYVGMSEKYIDKTALGKPSSTVRHNREMVNGQSLVANLYDYTRNGNVIYTARCVNGVVTNIFDHRDDPYKQSSGSNSSNSSKKSSSSTKKSDPFHASDYAHPDDFYYDYYDDFWDYEDAEDYWEAHH